MSPGCHAVGYEFLKVEPVSIWHAKSGPWLSHYLYKKILSQTCWDIHQ
jgi:hypothetical protein